MEDRNSVSSFEGCNTASSSNLSSTSRLYASGSTLSTSLGANAHKKVQKRGNGAAVMYRSCDAGLDPQEQVHKIYNTPDAVYQPPPP